MMIVHSLNCKQVGIVYTYRKKTYRNLVRCTLKCQAYHTSGSTKNLLSPYPDTIAHSYNNIMYLTTM